MTLDSRKVYLMDAGSFTKIGYSTDPEARLSSAQSGNPQPMRLTGVIETNHAPHLEEKLHELLSDYRCEMGGGKEWFDLPEDIHDVLAGTSYLSTYTLEVLQKSGVREPETEDPLLYLDSVSITPEQTREEQRELLRSTRKQKDRICDQQRTKQHTTRCIICDTEGPSGKALMPTDASPINKTLARIHCRECTVRMFVKDVAPKCVTCGTKYTRERSLPPNDAHPLDRFIAQDMCRECADDFLKNADPPKCTVCGDEDISRGAFLSNDAPWIKRLLAPDLCRECAVRMSKKDVAQS